MGNRLEQFFGIGGPVMKFGSFLFDLIVLDILWLFMSGAVLLLVLFYLFGHTVFANVPAPVGYLLMYLVIINWGPATVPLYYTLSKRNRGHETYIIRDYFRSYRMNFRQSIILSAVVTLIAALLVYNIFLIGYNQEVFGAMAHVLYVFQFVILAELYIFTIHAVALLARLKLTLKALVHDAFINANKHLGTSIGAGLVVAIGIGMLWFDQIFLFLFLPSFICYLVALIMEKSLLSKYIPDEDDLTDVAPTQ